ncbi:unnamed protein product [Spirodela intermedia]|uniref:XS domain-containing protein n=1 Tax=Spirodela intermedia TaxID=51605 RepID=A0A7I8ILD2_SPIIN|nr:unnamed protein product [Spirodela intermedia]CAA6658556.1 unnamed protein product [Spirodela intermedia]
MHYGNPNANVVGFPPGSGDRADFLGRSGSPRRDHLDDVRLSKHAKLGGDAYDHFSHRRRGDADASSVVIDVNPDALNRAFLRFSKTINENASLKKNFLENGKNGPLSCLACGRVSKEFGDMHALVMHTYYSQNADLRVDHLGLHKALCVLMGWNFKRLPETSKAYQSLSAEAATENREDLILWPPIVIIHYTSFGQRKKDGRVEGMGNKELDNKLKDLGFGGGRSRTMMNGKEGIPFGTAAVRFAGDRDGLREAEQLAELLERDGCGRRSWARISQGRRRPEEGKEGEAADGRILLYGYLGIAGDMDELDAETKKKAVLHSRGIPPVSSQPLPPLLSFHVFH